VKPAFSLILLGLGLGTQCMAEGQAQGETQLTLPPNRDSGQSGELHLSLVDED
jgi:hypothetical protein